MKHYLITVWNVNNLDPEWLKERHRLFEEYCLPSVMAQTNKDFEWILVADSRTPKQFRRKLRAYPASVLYHDFGATEWDLNPATQPRHNLACNLEYAVAAPLSSYIGTPDTDYIITSRLNSDDAISIDYIDRVQKNATPGEEGGRFWVNLTKGYKLVDSYVYNHSGLQNPFISFVEPPEEILTTYQVTHGEAIQTGYPVRQVEGEPTWLHIAHHGNLLNTVRRNRKRKFEGKKPFSTVADRFKVEGADESVA